MLRYLCSFVMLITVSGTVFSFSEYDEFGLGEFRYRSYGDIDQYDPYTGTWNFVHMDAEIKSSQSLSVPIIRQASRLGSRYTDRVGDWSISFGRLVRTSWSTDNACESALGSAFITPSGAVKQFHPRLVENRHGGLRLVSKDGWQTYCWKASSSSPGFEYALHNNPRGRDEVVVVDPTGTKYIIGSAVSWGYGYTGENEWQVTRVETVSGDWYEINYGTKTNLKRGDDTSQVGYISSVNLSDGSIINFNYVTERLRHGSSKYIDAFYIDNIVYRNRTMVDYQYVNKTDSNGTFDSKYLIKAQLPENTAWSYEDPKSAKLLERIIVSPDGLRGHYYFHFSYNNYSSLSSLKAKSVTYSSGTESRTTSFEYENHNPVSSSYTIVKTGSTCSKYYHWNDKNTPRGEELFKRGALKEVQIFGNPSCSEVLKSISYTYIPFKLSDTDEVRKKPDATYHETRVPVLQKKLIKHFVDKGVDTYKTEYSNFDLFFNPQTIVETFSSTEGFSRARTHTKTYYNDLTLWVHSLPRTSSTSGVSGQIVYSYFNGKLRSKSNYGNVFTYSYDQLGNLSSVVDPVNNVIDYSAFKKGVPQEIDFPEGVKEAVEVDDFGNILSHSINGRTIEYGYDGLNRLKLIDYPGNRNDITYSYAQNENGLLVIQTMAEHRIETQYDSWGNEISKKIIVGDLPNGTSNSFTWTKRYDNEGRMKFASMANSDKGTEYNYNSLNQVIAVVDTTDNSQVEIEYLPGNKIQTISPLGVTSTKQYLAFGSPETELIVSIIDESLGRVDSSLLISPYSNTTIKRNNIGLVETVTRGSYTHKYEYASDWQLDKVTTPETGTTDYDYDSAGRMVGVQYAGFAKTIYTYDGLHRLRGINYPDSAPDIDIFYLPNSTLVDYEVRGDWKRSYSYTDNLEIETESLLQISSGKVLSLEYDYDAYGNLKHIVYPSEKKATYTLDSLGRASSVVVDGKVLVEKIQYYDSLNPFALKEMTFGNNLVETFALDQKGRLKTQTLSSTLHGELLYRELDFDREGHISQISQTGQVTSFIAVLKYDQLNQLRSISGPNWLSSAFSYDGIGNIKEKINHGSTLSYSYNSTSNLLESVKRGAVTTKTFTYSSAGAVKGNSELHFQYLSDQLLHKAGSTSAVNDHSFEFDSRGLKAKKTFENRSTYSVYGFNRKLYSEISHEGKSIDYFYLGDRVIASQLICEVEDTNGNGISDCEENYLNGLDSDMDGDGLSNAEEIKIYFTNHRVADTDGDELTDGDEVRLHNTNPISTDTDGDGLSDEQEILGFELNGQIYKTNPNKRDTDGDGLSDGDELLKYGTDPNKTDTDGDGRSDFDELHPVTLSTTLRVYDQASKLVTYRPALTGDTTDPFYYVQGSFNSPHDESSISDVKNPLIVGVQLLSPKVNEQDYTDNLPDVIGYNIEYRYTQKNGGSSSWVTVKNWSTLANRGVNRYWVVLNNEMLTNQFEAAPASTQHKVEIRATDLHGNARTFYYTFKVYKALDNAKAQPFGFTDKNPLSNSNMSNVESMVENTSQAFGGVSFKNTFDESVYVRPSNINEHTVSATVQRESWTRENRGYWVTKKHWKVYGANSCSWKPLPNGTYYDITERLVSRLFAYGDDESLRFGGLYAREESDGDNPEPYSPSQMRNIARKTVAVTDAWTPITGTTTVNTDNPTRAREGYVKQSDDNWGLIGNTGKLAQWDSSSRTTYEVHEIRDLYHVSNWGKTNASAVITESCGDLIGDWGNTVKSNATYSDYTFRTSSTDRGKPNFEVRNWRAQYGYEAEYKWVPQAGYPRNIISRTTTVNWPLGSTSAVVGYIDNVQAAKMGDYYRVEPGETLELRKMVDFLATDIYETVSPIYGSARNKDVRLTVQVDHDMDVEIIHGNGLSDLNQLTAMPALKYQFRQESSNYVVQ